MSSPVWWCISIDGPVAYIERQLKHWEDGKAVFWSEKTEEISTSLHRAAGNTYYAHAANRIEALRLVNEYRIVKIND